METSASEVTMKKNRATERAKKKSFEGAMRINAANKASERENKR
jgi:hypothetical protein